MMTDPALPTDKTLSTMPMSFKYDDHSHLCLVYDYEGKQIFTVDNQPLTSTSQTCQTAFVDRQLTSEYSIGIIMILIGLLIYVLGLKATDTKPSR